MTVLATVNENIKDVELREKMVNRVEVLEKVKGLLLLPAIEKAATQQVADFYEVDLEAIYSIVRRHSDELVGDGMITLKRKDLVLTGQVDQLEITPYTAIIKDEKGNETCSLIGEVWYSQNGLSSVLEC